MIAIYAAAKFMAYCTWCGVGLRWIQPPDTRLASAARLGTVRWVIGLAFGVAVFFSVGSITAPDVARTYFLIYTPIRAIEWSIVAFLIVRTRLADTRQPAPTALVLWCVGGILVSFFTDFLSPEGLQGRFCIGRCLC